MCFVVQDDQGAGILKPKSGQWINYDWASQPAKQ